jgi:hypothetical protein
MPFVIETRLPPDRSALQRLRAGAQNVKQE